MKKLLLIVFIVWAVLMAGNLFAQTHDIQGLLNTYLDIKNALVSSDSKEAAIKATEFVTALNEIDPAKLQEQEQQAFAARKDQLLEIAQTLSDAKDIEKQRIVFGDFPQSFWEVIKQADSISQPVYYAYCPMKKAYWLSAEAAIKTPYYGAQMLACGSVVENHNQ